MTDDGASFGPGSREPSPAVSAASGFDPSRDSMNEEASVFAAYLLMPDHLLHPMLDGLSLDDDRRLEIIARRFRVPVGAVVYRIMLERKF